MGRISQGLKNEFELSMVNEPSVFELLRFDCILVFVSISTRRGVLLCKDSNTSEWIYIIKTGSCRVLKDLIETKPNIPGLEFIDYSTFDSSIST